MVTLHVQPPMLWHSDRLPSRTMKTFVSESADTAVMPLFG
jgi:hypothetical protein